MSFRVTEEGNGFFDSDRPLNGLDVLAKSGRQLGNIVAWRVNRYLRPLSWEIAEDCAVTFVDTSCFEGKEAYRRTLTFLLVLACRKLLDKDVVVRHSLSDGYYCEIPGEPLASSQVEAVRQGITDLVALDLPIVREVLSLDRAISLFEAQGNLDKAELLRWIGADPVEIYRIGDRSGFFYGPLAPSTGTVGVFDLVSHLPGMVLRFPTVAYPAQLPPFQPPVRLSDVFLEYSGWLGYPRGEHHGKPPQGGGLRPRHRAGSWSRKPFIPSGLTGLPKTSLPGLVAGSSALRVLPVPARRRLHTG